MVIELVTPRNPCHVTYGMLCILFLVKPIHLATQSDPTVLHHHLDAVTRYPNIPVENVCRRPGDVFVVALVRARQL